MRPWVPPIAKLFRIRGASLELSIDTTTGANGAAWSSDGQEIVVAGDDGVVRGWAIHSEGQVRALSGHGGAVLAVAYSPSGGRLASASADGTARIWDATHDTLAHVLSKHGEPVWSLAWSRDGSRLVTGSDDCTARLWDGRSGALLATCHTAEALLGVRGAQLGPERTMVSLTHTGVAHLWERGVEQPLSQIAVSADVLLSGRFACLAIAPDRRRLAAGRGDGAICLFALDAPLSVLSSHSAAVTSLDWHPNGRWLVSGSEDGSACVWDVTSRTLVCRVDHPSVVRGVAVHPEGQYLATVADDATLRIHRFGCDWWDFEAALVQAEALIEWGGTEVALWPLGKTALDLDVFLDVWCELRTRAQHLELSADAIERGRRLRTAIVDVLLLLCEGASPEIPASGVERFTHPLYRTAVVDYGLAVDLLARLGGDANARARLDALRPGSRSVPP